MLHHQNPVGVLDGGQAVRNDEGGLSLHQVLHGPLHLLLGVGIHVAGGLVQNEHLRVVEHGAGDGQQLLLSLADVAAVLADHGVIALRQAHDVAVDACGLGRGHHFLHGGALLAVGDVVKNGAAKYPCILQHHRIGAAQGIARHLTHLAAIYQNFSAFHVVKAHEEVDEGGFARARMPHNGNGLARLGPEVQIVQHGLARRVAKADMPGLHGALHVREHLRAGRIRRLLRLIQQGKNPLRRGQRGIDFIDDVGDFVDRAAKFAGVEHEGRNLLHAHAAQQIQGGSHHADEGQPQVVDHVDGGAGGHA